MNRRDLLKSLLAVAGASVAATTMMTPEAVVAAVAGKPVTLPWLPCDGRDVDQAAYRELFQVLADMPPEIYQRESLSESDFSIPNLGSHAFNIQIHHFRTTRSATPAPIQCRYWIKATSDGGPIPVGTIVLIAGEPGKPIGAEIAV
jgi:hypothetical protein